MRIVHIAPEFAPLAKAGGLGDVVYGLAKQQALLGFDVSVLIPKYSFLPQQNWSLMTKNFLSFENDAWQQNSFWQTNFQKINIISLESSTGYFSRDSIYGYPDDTARFLLFSKTSLEWLLTQEPIDILHLHDWPTAFIGSMLKNFYSHTHKIKNIVLTIHNLEYQGVCAPWDLDRIGIDSKRYASSNINLLKEGILSTDRVITVSPTYAKEIITPQGGYGLDKTLLSTHKLQGILNGIDYDFWNPLQDPNIAFPISMQTVEKDKQKNKLALQKKLGLKQNLKVPLICSVSRLAHQKGPDLIRYGLLRTIEKGGQFVLLASCPDPKIQKEFLNLQKSLEDSSNVAFHLDFNEELAHLLYAASDYIFIPSIAEPCGLTQMIACHYGTIPIARKTGGLADTVFDIDETLSPAKKNGFLFVEENRDAVNHVIDRAFTFFDSVAFLHLMKKNMQQDFSWEVPAKNYLSVYEQLLRENQMVSG